MLKRLLFAVALALIAASPAGAKPPVWVVRDADSTIVLFGSVHLLPPGLDWRPAELDAALKDADDLWFELPVDPAASNRAARIVSMQGRLPEGQRLSDKLSLLGRGRLKRAVERLHLSQPAIERMRPWLAEVTLGVAQLAASGANASDGVERAIAADAPDSAKRHAFETPEQQVAFFAGAPEKDQLASLENSLRQMEGDPGAYAKLIDAWMAGDLRRLERRGVRPMRRAAPGLYRSLMVERNAVWTDTLIERLAGSGETVVVVGAAHLVGKDGVPAMLRARGIAVEGP